MLSDKFVLGICKETGKMNRFSLLVGEAISGTTPRTGDHLDDVDVKLQKELNFLVNKS